MSCWLLRSLRDSLVRALTPFQGYLGKYVADYFDLKISSRNLLITHVVFGKKVMCEKSSRFQGNISEREAVNIMFGFRISFGYVTKTFKSLL